MKHILDGIKIMQHKIGENNFGLNINLIPNNYVEIKTLLHQTNFIYKYWFNTEVRNIYLDHTIWF